MRWCSDHGITVTTIERSGDLTSAWSPELGRTDGRLIRCQALSGTTGPYSDIGLTIARQILSDKIQAQAKLIRLAFGKDREASEITAYLEKIATATTMAKLREHEAHAALWYFGVWTGRVAIPWHRDDIDRVPVNWCNFAGRKSLVGDGKRHATDPVNALLNYCYTLGYAESRTACIKAGLDPRLGYFHNDSAKRDSLALDVLEAVRPEIDKYILGMLGLGGPMRKFTPKDFREASLPHFPGTCRIVAPLTHELCEQSVSWSNTAESVTSAIVRALLAIPVNGRDAIRPVKSVDRGHGSGKFSARASVRQIVPDKAWRSIRETIPPREARYGPPPIEDRVIVAGIAWCEGNGVTYGKVPTSLGISSVTMRRRVIEWEKLGVWDDIIGKINKAVL